MQAATILTPWGVMEPLGMRREAQLREAVYKEVKWVDKYICGMLSDE